MPIGSDAPVLSVRGVRKSYGSTAVLNAIDLDVAAGTVVAITGPSGAGKTTLLRVIAGDEALDTGSVTVDGWVVADERTDVDPIKRSVASVPQGGGLLDERKVSAIIALALPRKVRNSRAGAARVAAMVDLVGLPDALAGRLSSQLSVSERQRVALARALVGRPSVLLLDEPFSAFDPAARARFRSELGALLRQSGAATVLVSHHESDVVELADRHYRLTEGRLTDRPLEGGAR